MPESERKEGNYIFMDENGWWHARRSSPSVIELHDDEQIADVLVAKFAITVGPLIFSDSWDWNQTPL
jgi:hypothetical protein